VQYSATVKPFAGVTGRTVTYLVNPFRIALPFVAWVVVVVVVVVVLVVVIVVVVVVLVVARCE
jgi:hypothetical protein